MDIAVLPGSTAIICPIKIQEYMAAELPPVLPDYPVNREVVAQGARRACFSRRRTSIRWRTFWWSWPLTHPCQRIGRSAREEILARFTWK